MKYCPHCGTAIQDNNNFCANCGQPVMVVRNTPIPNQAQQYYSQAPVQLKKKHTIRTIFMLIGILTVVTWLYNSFFTVAHEIEAETGEKQYSAMIEAYSNGDYKKSMEYCEKLGDYKDTAQYADLIKARVIFGYFNNLDEVIEHAKKLLQNFNFADTKDVLVSNDYIGIGYLLGYWTTSNGNHTFEMKQNGSYTTTIPVVPKAGDTYEIENGMLNDYYKDNDFTDRSGNICISDAKDLYPH